MAYYLEHCLPSVAILVSAWILILIIGRIVHACATPKESMTNGALRPGGPGGLLLGQLDGFNRSMYVLTAQLTALPLLLYGAYVTYMLFVPDNSHWLAPVLLAIGGVAFVIERILRLREIKAEYRTARLGYEDKLVTGQALTPLMQEGYVVFHEVCQNGLVVDYIVIGPKGVFVIHTHSHPRPHPPDSSDNIAIYDGRILRFENKEEHAAIERVVRVTEQFSEWISVSLPEAIAARAILALPGWTIKRTSVDGISVVNPKQFKSLFQYVSTRSLEPEVRKTISDLIAATYRQATPPSTTPDPLAVSARVDA
jgi:hypothetical protein